MKKNLKFLLINPTAPCWRVEPDQRPAKRTRIFRYSMLSSLYVAAALPANVEVQIIDEEIEPINFESDADLIGISFMTYNAPRAYEIADKFRREKSKPVIVGGYHPTFMPEEAIQHADAVCIGEAETNVPKMIEDFYNGGLKPFYNNCLIDLCALPIPDRGLLKDRSYAIVDALQATRGCNHQCRFCSISTFFNQQFRMRPVEKVVAEIKELGKYLLFMDDNLTLDPNYAKALFRAMIPLNKRWFSQASITIADDPDLMTLAYRSGCRGLFIGFESVGQASLTSWHKNMNRVSDYEGAIKNIHNHGIAICAGIVFGNDYDEADIFEKTTAFLRHNNIDALQATILTPFPGTPLFKELDREGRITDKNWDHYDFNHVVFKPKNLSPSQLINGHSDVLKKFYSAREMTRKILTELKYLNLATIARASIPLNMSYRVRLKANCTF